MKVKILKIPQLRFLPFENLSRHKYLLADSTYGEMLLFENNEPKYYINLFSDMYSDLREYISLNKHDTQKVLSDILKLNKSKVTTEQNLLGIDLSSRERIVEVDIDLFPVEFWNNYKKQNPYQLRVE